MALAAVSYAGIPASALPAVTGDSGRPGFRWKQDVCAHCWGVLEGGPEFTKPEHRQVGCPLHTGGLVWARGEIAPRLAPRCGGPRAETWTAQVGARPLPERLHPRPALGDGRDVPEPRLPVGGGGKRLWTGTQICRPARLWPWGTATVSLRPPGGSGPPSPESPH